MLADLTVKDFLDKVACSDPVPGGGSIAALNGALASSLSTMVARLTVGNNRRRESRPKCCYPEGNQTSRPRSVGSSPQSTGYDVRYSRCCPSR